MKRLLLWPTAHGLPLCSLRSNDSDPSIADRHIGKVLEKQRRNLLPVPGAPPQSARLLRRDRLRSVSHSMRAYVRIEWIVDGFAHSFGRVTKAKRRLRLHAANVVCTSESSRNYGLDAVPRQFAKFVQPPSTSASGSSEKQFANAAIVVSL